MAKYKQFKIGNMSMPTYNSDKSLLLDGDLNITALDKFSQLYWQFFRNKFSSELNSWSFSGIQSIGSTFQHKDLLGGGSIIPKKPIITDEQINADISMQNVILDSGEWIYNNRPIKATCNYQKVSKNNYYGGGVVLTLWYFNGTNWVTLGALWSESFKSVASIEEFSQSYITTSYPAVQFDLAITVYNDKDWHIHSTVIAKDGLSFVSSDLNAKLSNICYYGDDSFTGIPLTNNTNPEPAPNTDVTVDEIDTDNPYSGGGMSTTGGGKGSFDKDSDPVDFTPLPTLSAIGSGFAGLFSPTLSQIRELANYLWNNELNWEQLVKLVANPIDLLISLTVVPVKPKTSTAENIKVGFISTGVSMHKCDEQYVKFNCGKLTVDRYYDSALDFAPFTKIYIYLPFIGQRELNADDVVGNDLEVEYNIDLFTGTCVAEIKVADSVLYSFEGNVASQIPIIAESFDQLASAIIGAVATVGTVAVAAGAGAAAAGATAAEGGADAAGIAAARSAGASAELTKAAPRLASAGANTVISSKPSISHAGSASANIGLLAQKTPYLIYQIPRQSIADSYQTFNGFPSNMTATLGELSGFTQVERIHLENIPATSRELDIIEAKLKEGVLL